jgi:hypothetical protein
VIAMLTRSLAGTVEVDGLKYEWQLLREPQWCTADGWQGMTVSLREADARREAILEFPMPTGVGNGSPHRRRPAINDTIATNGVGAALAAGWEPASRGKPVTFMVDANGN